MTGPGIAYIRRLQRDHVEACRADDYGQAVDIGELLANIAVELTSEVERYRAAAIAAAFDYRAEPRR